MKLDKKYRKELWLLRKLCKKSFPHRHDALVSEIERRGRMVTVLPDGTVVLEALCYNPIALVAHYDSVRGSYGYNDNGMSLVAVLGLLDALPYNVEVVFTNGEERGLLGAEKYLEWRNCKVKQCINLDATGYGDRVYVDRMNSVGLDGLADSVCFGTLPMNDAWAFYRKGIRSVCVSTGDSGIVSDGVDRVMDTMHGGFNDNRLDLLNYELPSKVRDVVMKIIKTVAAA